MNGKLVNLKGEAMSSTYSKRDLMLLYQELDQLHRGPLGWLLGNRFSAFKKANHQEYKKINDELLDLQKQFCEMVPAKGSTFKDALVIKNEKDEKGEVRPVMLPGKTIEDYMKAQAELLSKPCQINRPRPMDY